MITSLGITCAQIQEIEGLEHIKEYDVYSVGTGLTYYPSLQRIQSTYYDDEIVVLFPIYAGDTLVCYSNNSYKEIMLLVKHGIKVYLVEKTEEDDLKLVASL